MPQVDLNATPSRRGLIIGWVLSGVFALFMLGASVAPKLMQMPVAEATMVELGWPAGHTLWIGILELALTVLYLIPRTRVLGAVLMTGLLGGAIATQVHADSPLFSHILFGLYLGAFMWGGLWLRDPAVRALAHSTLKPSVHPARRQPAYTPR